MFAQPRLVAFTSFALVLLAVLAGFAILGCAPSKRSSGASSAERAELAAELDTMVTTERLFAALAADSGLRTAFLRHLGGDAIDFDPLPGAARPRVERWRPSEWAILWEPAYAEIASSGDLGFDTGPCDIRPPASTHQDTIRGQFNSIWRKEADGVWRLVADLGVDVSPPAAIYGQSTYRAGELPEPTHVAGGGGATGAAGSAGPAPDLTALDRILGDNTKAHGVAAGIAGQMAADGRVHHQGLPAAVGPGEVESALDPIAGAWAYLPSGSGVARSHDFGYTYGVLEHVTGDAAGAGSTPLDSSVYLHVWKRPAGGEWKLALAVVRPLRP